MQDVSLLTAKLVGLTNDLSDQICQEKIPQDTCVLRKFLATNVYLLICYY